MKKIACDEIIRKLEYELALLKSRTHDFFMLIEQAMGLCENAIIEIREMVFKNGFCDQDDEVYFFKFIKPCVNSKLIFYTELFTVESHRPQASRKIQTKYFENVIQKLQSYFDENIEFYQYYKRKQTYSDHLYFVRENANWRIHIDNIINRIDPEFSTDFDQTLAKIMAYEALMKYTSNEIEKLNNQDTLNSSAEWSGQNVDAAELIYALISLGVINNGKMGIKELARLFEKMFNINLDDIYRIFKDIQGRTTLKKTRFLDDLKEALLKRLDDMDK